MDYPLWVGTGPNLLSPAYRDCVEQALKQGWIFGIHMFYGGGRSGDPIVFEDWERYREHVEASRPGDAFTLWSVADLKQRNALLGSKSSGEAACSPSLDLVLRSIEEYIGREQHEVVVVGRASGSNDPQILWLDWGWLDEIRDLIVSCNGTEGEWYAVPLNKVDSPEFYLAQAKRPNDRGEVPVRGPY